MYSPEKELLGALGSLGSLVFECLLLGIILNKRFPLEEIKDNDKECLDPWPSIPESAQREEPRCESEGTGAPGKPHPGLQDGKVQTPAGKAEHTTKPWLPRSCWDAEEGLPSGWSHKTPQNPQQG